jgi:hypothetical protein
VPAAAPVRNERREESTRARTLARTQTKATAAAASSMATASITPPRDMPMSGTTKRPRGSRMPLSAKAEGSRPMAAR